MVTTSSNIKVFPAARRIGSADPFSRLMSESTIASIINRLIGSEGFIITSSDNAISSGVFEFNLFGYYIKINDIASIISTLSSGTEIYATIFLETFQSGDLSYVELVGSDADSNYNGVQFTTTVPADQTNKEKHYLKILEKVDGSWKIPAESRIKFGRHDFSIDAIDGGEI